MADDEPKKEVEEKPDVAKAEGEEDENRPAKEGDEEDTGAAFTPIVQLKEVEVTSGEEDEDVLFEIKSKLYRFDKDKNEWKERGVGQAKILRHKENKKIRLLMRQSRTLKICCNHIILPGMSLQEHAGSDKSWVWHAADFADGELKEELFAMRFGSIESAQKFKDAFESATEEMEKVLGKSEKPEDEGADEAADALGGLKVKEDASEEKEPTDKDTEKKEVESIA